MSEVRILVFGVHDKIGGVETYCMNYFRNFDNNVVCYDFINMYEKICFEDEIRRLAGKIYDVTNVKKNPFKYYFEICNVIKNGNYNTVHINMLSVANILPILAAKRCGVKNIIVHSHNTNTPKGLVRKFLDKLNKKFVKKHSTHFFACSNMAGKWMFGEKVDFKVIRNAVDLKKFEYNEKIRKIYREKLGINDELLIGHVGRFSEQKNHEFLIDIYNDFCKYSVKSKLLLIGEGDLKEDIITKIKKYNIEDNVIVLEPVSNVYEYMQAMDIFILPSLFEGLPVVAVEAQATGLKVVAADTITKELPIDELSEYIGLENIEQWCEVLKNCEYGRKSTYEKMTESGYNICEEAIKLQEFYLEIN